MPKPRSSPLTMGEAAPWFAAPVIDGAKRYAFDSAGGRPILMLLFGSAEVPACAEALALVQARRELFDDANGAFFGVSVNPDDEAQRRIGQQLPGIRFFLDYDLAVSRAFGAVGGDKDEQYRPHWLLLDRALRVVRQFQLGEGEAALDAFATLAALPPSPDWAPVVMVSNVLEPELCRRLIALYDAHGGLQSGFMRDVGGKTVELLDPAMKVRRDCPIEDPGLARQLNLRLIHRLNPMIERAFMFKATRVERLIVGCYEADDGGHFRAHRDNTTRGTAHRRFAVTVNLNAEEYEGGDLAFPEFGARTYRAPTGGAVVFSCALMHQAMPVTRGRRYAFLPFLYDEEGAKLRERNAKFLEGEAANYRAARDVVVR